ncbi:MAG: hypothetical protein F4Y25_12990 [Chloroflexi bacterium]|nr:hypothetical protein [Chloroflexota bacterium]
MLDNGAEPYCQPVMKLSAPVKRPWVRFDWTEQLLNDVARWVNRRVWKSGPFDEYRRFYCSEHSERRTGMGIHNLDPSVIPTVGKEPTSKCDHRGSLPAGKYRKDGRPYCYRCGLFLDLKRAGTVAVLLALLLLVACSSPTPTPTPEPTPTPIPTGSWVTWEEVQQRTIQPYGVGPVIALKARGVPVWLYVECYWGGTPDVIELSVLWPNRMRIPTLPDEEPPAPHVAYALDGELREVAAWRPSAYDPTWDGAYAPPTQADDILDALQAGASEFAVRVEGGAGGRFMFYTEGFTEAFLPVIGKCGAV